MARMASRAMMLVGVCASVLAGGAAWGQGKAPEMPGDPGVASLRVNALMELYELDLSQEQLKALRAAAAKTASSEKRAAAKGTPALRQAFGDLQAALLEKKDDQAIVDARNKVVELTADLDLDDDVNPTEAALAKAPAFRKQLRASQIAASLAVHADELSDPTELALGAVDALREMRGENKNGSKNGEMAALVAETGQTIGYLVCGADAGKANALAGRVSDWVKATSELGEKEYDAQRATQEEAVQKMIGEVDPMEVLGHWVNFRLAQLMSNPELPRAIDATIAAREANP